MNWSAISTTSLVLAVGMRRWLVAALWLATGLAAAHAETRVALVIGNSDYAHANRLANPVKDADAVAEVLTQAHFTVTRQSDLGFQAMLDALKQFKKVANDADVALVYFAGHGLEMKGVNYLVPVDARLSRDDDVQFEAVTLDVVRWTVSSARMLRIVLVDACRDNPFLETMTLSDGEQRGFGERGLARIEETRPGEVVFFAAKERTTAQDDVGGHSPFATALIKEIPQPLELNLLIRTVSDDVSEMTNRKQLPYAYQSLSKQQFYFVPPAPAPEKPVAPAFDPRQIELAVWQAVADSNDIAEYESYLAKYPNGNFADIARLKIASLTPVAEVAHAPSVPTPVPPESHATAESPSQPPPAPRPAPVTVSTASPSDTAHLNQPPSSKPPPASASAQSPGPQPQRLQTAAVQYPNTPSGGTQAATLSPNSTTAPAANPRPQPPRTPAAQTPKTIGGQTQIAMLTPSSTIAPTTHPIFEHPAQSVPAGKMFKDCENCPQMVTVPAGGFTMGSPDSESGRYAFEGPMHTVTMSRSIAMGKYDVTFDEWAACVAGGGCRGYKPNNEGWGEGNHPVVNISWEDAEAYVEWLSKTTGKSYRLPSEAEWEYAARATSVTAFFWGDDPDPRLAVYASTSGTLPVGSTPPNKWGLYDMLGNVWQWTADCYHRDYAGAPSGGSAWTDGDCSQRILRGGSWLNKPRNVRSAYRNWFNTHDRFNNYGFRVVRDL